VGVVEERSAVRVQEIVEGILSVVGSCLGETDRPVIEGIVIAMADVQIGDSGTRTAGGRYGTLRLVGDSVIRVGATGTEEMGEVAVMRGIGTIETEIGTSLEVGTEML